MTSGAPANQIVADYVILGYDDVRIMYSQSSEAMSSSHHQTRVANPVTGAPWTLQVPVGWLGISNCDRVSDREP